MVRGKRGSKAKAFMKKVEKQTKNVVEVYHAHYIVNRQTIVKIQYILVCLFVCLLRRWPTLEHSTTLKSVAMTPGRRTRFQL